MNTLELIQVANSHPKLKKYFKGVYAVDQIPKLVHSYPSAYIINTQPIRKPGDHWVAIWFDGLYKATFFDSYGLPPQNKRIVRFLKRNTKWWNYSRKVLQYPLSFLCGQYCLLFLVKKSQGISLKNIRWIKW